MKTILAFILVLIATEVRAELDGNELLRRCDSIVKQSDGKQLGSDEQTGADFCAGYFFGFSDSHSIETLIQKTPYFCFPPQGIEVAQQVRIVVKYLKENPAILHESARASVAIALAQAFPCRTKK